MALPVISDSYHKGCKPSKLRPVQNSKFQKLPIAKLLQLRKRARAKGAATEAQKNHLLKGKNLADRDALTETEKKIHQGYRKLLAAVTVVDKVITANILTRTQTPRRSALPKKQQRAMGMLPPIIK